MLTFIKTFLLVALITNFSEDDTINSSSKALVKAPCTPCSAAIERIEYEDIPGHDRGEFYESWNPIYSTHYISDVSFSNGIGGRLFKGGISKRYFVADSDGGRRYYVNLKAGIRGLYLYKRYNCLSSRYTY